VQLNSTCMCERERESVCVCVCVCVCGCELVKARRDQDRVETDPIERRVLTSCMYVPMWYV
jgi:hypothetical protein